MAAENDSAVAGGGRAGLAIGGLAVAACLAFSLVDDARNAVKANRARSWPTVTGRLTENRLVESESTPTHYWVAVTYHYEVDGVERHGHNIGFGYKTVARHEAAPREVQKKLGRGDRVVVRYNPADPAEASLTCGVSAAAIASLGAGVAGVLFGLLLSTLALRSVARRRSLVAMVWVMFGVLFVAWISLVAWASLDTTSAPLDTLAFR